MNERNNQVETHVNLDDINLAYKPEDYDGEDLAVGVWNGYVVVYPDSNKTLQGVVRVGSFPYGYSWLQERGIEIADPGDLWQ